MQLDELLPGQPVLVELEEGDIEARFGEITDEGGAIVADENGELLEVEPEDIVASKPTTIDKLEERQPELLGAFLLAEMLEDEGLGDPKLIEAASGAFAELEEGSRTRFRRQRRRRRVNPFRNFH